MFLPSENFAAFTTSADFAGAVRAAGLPEVRVEPVGDVHATHVRAGVAP